LPTSKTLTIPAPGRIGSTNRFPATIAISPDGGGKAVGAADAARSRHAQQFARGQRDKMMFVRRCLLRRNCGRNEQQNRRDKD